MRSVVVIVVEVGITSSEMVRLAACSLSSWPP
jgi:hypothetical protein